MATAEANKYSQEQLRLMKTQDVGYLNLKSQAERRKVERMQESLHMIGAPAQRQHVVFVDGAAEAAGFDPSAHFDTPAELLGRTYNRPRRSQLEDASLVSTGPRNATAAASSAERRRASAYRELLQRKSRQEALIGASQQLDYEKQVMGKGRKRKLRPEEAGGKKGIFRWTTERKK